MKDAALNNIIKAMKTYPDCNVLLTSRSYCYLQLEHWQEALDDAEAVLSDDPNDVNAIYCRAESLFSLCQFETSLCAFYRGRVKIHFNCCHLSSKDVFHQAMSTEKEQFDEGIKKCEKILTILLPPDVFKVCIKHM